MLDPPLKGAQLPVGEAPYVAALQILEEGLGLQARIEFELVSDLVPDVGKDVVVCRPGARGFKLAGQLPGLEVLPGGLLVEAVFGCSLGEGLLPLNELE